MRMPKLSARLRILLITYSMTIGLCACGSGSDNLPVDAPVADTYGEPSQSSAVPSSADTNISSADASSPETEAVADAEPLRDATPVCLVPRADGTATASNDVAVIDYSHMSDGYVPITPAPVPRSNCALPGRIPLSILTICTVAAMRLSPCLPETDIMT